MNKEINNQTIIESNNVRYLSELPEFKNGIPHGIVNKVLTDVGGTYCAVNCNHNYIVVVPFKDLANSIEADQNNKYNVFKLYGGIYKRDYHKYIADNQIKKFAVTYDSFSKLTSWLKQSGEDLTTYKVVVDEYHLILEDLDFRDTAINNVLNAVQEYKHYSYLSATPIDVTYLYKQLQELPYYRINWGDTEQITPIKIKTPNVYKMTSVTIDQFTKGMQIYNVNGELEQVKELHIFMNSVKGIEQICTTNKLDPDQVKIVCAESIRNNGILNKYSIASVTDQNKPINFYTKKGFQGCNIFSNNGLVIVVSDARKEHMLIDIETTLTQIVGRIRFNEQSQNTFRNTIFHIFSTNKNIMSDQEFESYIKQMQDDTEIVYKELSSMPVRARAIFLDRLNIETLLISKDKSNIYLNNDKLQLFKYKHGLQKVYKDGFTIRKSYNENTKFKDTNQYFADHNEIILSKVVSISLKELYQDYLNTDDKEMYLSEYPEFGDYNKYLTVTEMNTAKYSKQKLNDLVRDKKLLQLVHRKVFEAIDNQFYTSVQIKDLYQDAIDKVKIDVLSKGTLIEQNIYVQSTKELQTVNGKRARGYTVSKLIYNFNDLVM